MSVYWYCQWVGKYIYLLLCVRMLKRTYNLCTLLHDLPNLLIYTHTVEKRKKLYSYSQTPGAKMTAGNMPLYVYVFMCNFCKFEKYVLENWYSADFRDITSLRYDIGGFSIIDVRENRVILTTNAFECYFGFVLFLR